MGNIRSHSSEINDFMGVRGVSSQDLVKINMTFACRLPLIYLAVLSALSNAVSWRPVIFLTFVIMSFRINIQVGLGVLWLSISWPIVTFHGGSSKCQAFTMSFLWRLTLAELTLHFSSLWISLCHPVTCFHETCGNVTALELLSCSQIGLKATNSFKSY